MENNSNNGTGLLAAIIILFVLGIFFLFKYLIIGIIFIIFSICIWAYNSNNKKEKKKMVNNLLNECFNGSEIMPSNNISANDLKEKLGLFNINIYDDLFKPQIRKRGQEYFAEHKVKNVSKDDKKWNCEVEGKKTYNVSIAFDKEDENKIIEAHCDCPYHLDNNQNCKHIYALLTRAKCGNDLVVVSNKITDYSKRMAEMIKKESEYIKSNSNSLNVSINDISKIDSYIDQLQIDLQRLVKTLEDNYYNEDTILEEFVNIIKGSYNFNKCYEDFITKGTNKKNPILFQNTTESIEYNPIIDVIAINEIEKNRKKIKKNNKNNNFWNLDENEIRASKENGYDLWNFEEEELEEDDYYYEDDE